MSRRAPLLLFALAVPVMLLAALPLRLALDMADAGRAGLSARSASGSVWSGRLQGASLRGIELGNASVRLSPLPLLLGTRTVRLSAPHLDARLLQGRHRGIDRLDGRLAMPPSTLLAEVPLRVQAHGLRILFSADACHAAQGRITLVGDRADGSPLFTLEGSPACEGRAAVLPLAALAGEGPLARMQASLRLHPDGQWDIEARVPVVEDPAAGLMLEAAGFQPGPGGWSRTARGQLR